MKVCKHCGINFTGSTGEFANHVRWCPKNPKADKYKKDNSIRGKALGNQRFGNYKEYTVICNSCNTNFQVRERELLFPSKEKYFCSRNCANSAGGKAKSQKYHTDDLAHYAVVAWRYHDKECIICGESKIVAVHHYDENHCNNDPKNLIPLCPTHHQYMHSRFKIEIEEKVKKYIEDKWAVGVVGGTRALQA